MPNYVSTSNPLAEAAQFGGAAGQSLGQAMYGVPMQKAQMMMQVAQARAAQQRAMLDYALRQQQTQGQQQYQQEELRQQQAKMAQHKIEAAALLKEKQDEAALRKLQYQAEMLRAQNEQKGTWKLGETKAGRPYKINSVTGDISWLPTDEPTNGSPPEGSIPGAPMTQNQNTEDLANLARITALYQEKGINTDLPSVFQDLTNRIAQLGGQVPKRGGTPSPTPQLGAMTNASAVKSWPPTNASAPQAIPYNVWLQQ